MRRPIQLFALDLRALALMRIGVGSLLLYDLLERSFNLEAHYTDQGVLPRSSLGFAAGELTGPVLSLHTLSGSTAWQVVLFLLAALLAVALLVGYRTRWVTPLNLLLLLSLHHRNPVLLYGVDSLLRLVLVWGCFLPWGSYYSLDERREPTEETGVSSVAGACYLLQMALVVGGAGWHKSSGVWLEEQSGLYLSLNMLMYETGPGLALADWLLQHRNANLILCWLLVVWERFFPLLLLLGRKAALVSALLFFLASGVVLSVGMWPLAGIVCLLGCLPTTLWQKKKAPKFESTAPGLTALILLLALASFGDALGFRPAPLLQVTGPLGLQQRWEMFSRLPGRDIWPEVTVEGRFGSATVVGAASRPDKVSTTLGSIRWRRYFSRITYWQRLERLRPVLCAYFGRRWNRRHRDRPARWVTYVIHERRFEGLSATDFETKILLREPIMD